MSTTGKNGGSLPRWQCENGNPARVRADVGVGRVRPKPSALSLLFALFCTWMGSWTLSRASMSTTGKNGGSLPSWQCVFGNPASVPADLDVGENDGALNDGHGFRDVGGDNRTSRAGEAEICEEAGETGGSLPRWQCASGTTAKARADVVVVCVRLKPSALNLPIAPIIVIGTMATLLKEAAKSRPVNWRSIANIAVSLT